jgi:hypothetical protein
MSPNDTIEIEPHLLAGLMLYSIDAGSLYGRGTTGVIEIGAAAHILVDPKFGFNLTTGLRKIGSAVGRYGSPIVTPNLGYISFNSELRW